MLIFVSLHRSREAHNSKACFPWRQSWTKILKLQQAVIGRLSGGQHNEQKSSFSCVPFICCKIKPANKSIIAVRPDLALNDTFRRRNNHYWSEFRTWTPRDWDKYARMVNKITLQQYTKVACSTILIKIMRLWPESEGPFLMKFGNSG